MTLEITFLGTSGSIPTRSRNLPSIAIFYEGELILFDCGEGAQRQIAFAKLSLQKISKIFITHLHGDHILGLPGLLQTMDLNGRTRPLEVYGPNGIASFIESIKLTVPHSITFPLSVYEIKEGLVVSNSKYLIESAFMDHSISCLGYALIEKPKPGKFRKEVVERLGVPKGPLWKKLQMGESIEIAGKNIDASLVVGPPRVGVKVVYSGDTRPCVKLSQLADNADILIHDSTFDEARKDKALKYGHSTAKQAARTAEEANASKLILTHISPIYEGEEEKLVDDAKDIFHGKIQLAFDFLRIKI